MFTGKILGDLIFPSPISHHRLYGFSPLGFVSTEQEFADTQYDGPLKKVDFGLKDGHFLVSMLDFLGCTFYQLSKLQFRFFPVL